MGAASRDIDAADPRGWRLGGSVVYCSLAAARLGVEVRALAGVDEQAAGAFELGLLRRAGVDLRLVRLDRGPVFDNGPPAGRRVQVVLQSSDALPPAELPAGWRDGSAVMLVPVAAELDDSWAAVASDSALVALGWQGLLRRLVAGRPVEPLPLAPRPLSERADLAVVSAEDAHAGGAPLVELLTRPGQQLAVTHGALGALLVERTADPEWRLRMRRVPSVLAQRAVDTTGAGDVFLAAWTAARLAAPAAASESWRMMAVAAAAGSAAVELATLTDLPDAAALQHRLFRRRAAAERPGRPRAT